ncbi:APUM5 [Symbiodinium sp. CCMP2456]|nr:APUM5 [Symbiodinium sp. CCMP2456]
MQHPKSHAGEKDYPTVETVQDAGQDPEAQQAVDSDSPPGHTLKLSEHLSPSMFGPPPGLEKSLPTLLSGKAKSRRARRESDPKVPKADCAICTKEGAQALCAQLAGLQAPYISNFRSELVLSLLPDLPSLACDPHASQVIMQLITLDDDLSLELCKKIVRRLRGSLLKLTKDKHGCWIVQQALQCVPAELHPLLAFELRGKVLACSQHLHGNFVLQKCVELLSHGDVGFIVEELKNHAVDAASHIYSCRVLQRIIEHCPHDSPGMTELLNNLLTTGQLQKLAMDPQPMHLQHIARLFVDDCNILAYARNRHSSLVLERVLEAMTGEFRRELQEERDALMVALLGDEASNPPFTQMALDRFGNYIAQRVIEDSHGTEQQRILHLLTALGPKLRRAVNGRHILQAARRKFGSQLSFHALSVVPATGFEWHLHPLRNAQCDTDPSSTAKDRIEIDLGASLPAAVWLLLEFHIHGMSDGMLGAPVRQPSTISPISPTRLFHKRKAQVCEAEPEATADLARRVGLVTESRRRRELKVIPAVFISFSKGRERGPLPVLSIACCGKASKYSPRKKEKQRRDSAVVLQLAKTKMCSFYEKGKCSSETCRYAHSLEELRCPPNLQKTKLCKSFLQGKCVHGENCSFAHGDSDLRVTSGIYKTQMCNFYERGHCKKGDRCNHAHGDADLRPSFSPQKTPVREKGRMGVAETPDACTPPKVVPAGFIGLFQTPDARTPPKVVPAVRAVQTMKACRLVHSLKATCLAKLVCLSSQLWPLFRPCHFLGLRTMQILIPDIAVRTQRLHYGFWIRWTCLSIRNAGRHISRITFEPYSRVCYVQYRSFAKCCVGCLRNSRIAPQGPLHSLLCGSIERVFKQPPSWRVGLPCSPVLMTCDANRDSNPVKCRLRSEAAELGRVPLVASCTISG